MILTAHQPVYLPWLGLFHKIALADSFCHFDGVQYLKKDWNNRNKIKTAHGPLWLTVPVKTTGHRERRLYEIEINNEASWRAKHWKSIYLNYHMAPHFKRYAEFFEDLYKREWSHLASLNEYMLKWFLKELDINVSFSRASDFDFHGEKSDLVLDMCKQLGADTYVFGTLGKDYARVEDFEKEGIRVVFQEYRHPTYPQLYGEFAPSMSIIDCMFNCGDKTKDIIMSGNMTKADIV